MTNTDAHKQVNVKLPRLTQAQLSELATATGMTTTQIVIKAIDDMHRQYVQTPEHMAAQNQPSAA